MDAHLVKPLPPFGGNFPFMDTPKDIDRNHQNQKPILVSKMIIVCFPDGFDLRLGMFVATTLRSGPTTAFLIILCFVM